VAKEGIIWQASVIIARNSAVSRLHAVSCIGAINCQGLVGGGVDEIILAVPHVIIKLRLRFPNIH
jgi:hypothetical protein